MPHILQQTVKPFSGKAGVRFQVPGVRGFLPFTPEIWRLEKQVSGIGLQEPGRASVLTPET
jgi:hypothetical protein